MLFNKNVNSNFRRKIAVNRIRKTFPLWTSYFVVAHLETLGTFLFLVTEIKNDLWSFWLSLTGDTWLDGSPTLSDMARLSSHLHLWRSHFIYQI